jgi:hypothetical protein
MNVLSKIFNSINTELPRFDSLDQGIDYIMQYLWRFSEDLHEHEFYLNKRWKEVRDDVNFQESVLHVFKPDGQYLRILEGDINTGTWENSLGGFVIKFAGKHELYDKVFLNENFFILKKHGDQAVTRGQKKYFFIASERVARRREWVDLLDIMYEIYKGNTNYMMIVVIFFVIIAIIIFFSII